MVADAINHGHLELTVRELPRMAEFYRDPIGLAEITREPGTVRLSTVVDHSSLMLTQGGTTELTTIAPQVVPITVRRHRCRVAAPGLVVGTADGQPARHPRLVQPRNPDGLAVDRYPEAATSDHAYTHRDTCPLKLSHVASLSPNMTRLMAFYTDVLGFPYRAHGRFLLLPTLQS